VRLARKVTHPNVCRVFDVVLHHEPGGSPLIGLTMALLAGESLGVRLRRDGALGAQGALALARDMAAGLDAAHAAGILHRDFKSDNVQLVAARAATRAVVTDFGLARTTDDPLRSVIGARDVAGTPAYMAPEQVENRALTPAADVYAFGVVVYEMMTGKLPFSATSPLGVALQRLHEPPPALHLHRPDLPAAWGAMIERCLALDPARRFISAGEAIAALGDIHAPCVAPAPHVPSRLGCLARDEER
jgi:eukaryotic-like serine/threonine-protein kinase